MSFPAWSALLLVVFTGRVVHAGPISTNIWYEFGFDGSAFPFASGCAAGDPGNIICRPGVGTVNLDESPWTFTVSAPVLFNITDGFLAGDFYDVLDFGVVIGSTPNVSGLPGFLHSCGFDPRVCFYDPTMSHATLLLPAGSHSISIYVHQVQLAGEGFFVITGLPEPASGLLLAAGLIYVWLRKRVRPLPACERTRRSPESRK